MAQYSCSASLPLYLNGKVVNWRQPAIMKHLYDAKTTKVLQFPQLWNGLNDTDFLVQMLCNLLATTTHIKEVF